MELRFDVGLANASTLELLLAQLDQTAGARGLTSRERERDLLETELLRRFAERSLGPFGAAREQRIRRRRQFSDFA